MEDGSRVQDARAHHKMVDTMVDMVHLCQIVVVLELCNLLFNYRGTPLWICPDYNTEDLYAYTSKMFITFTVLQHILYKYLCALFHIRCQQKSQHSDSHADSNSPPHVNTLQCSQMIRLAYATV